ncbi:MAG: DUF4493 domain-containing protein [Muribaculaceae bacterium]|nr:DUF4493 domain-containing protein [Muribaculaceae bacterium]
MKRTLLYSMAVTGLAFLGGCGEDLPSGDSGQGSFNVKLTLDQTPVNVKGGSEDSRAAAITADDLKLTLTSHTGKKYTWNSLAEFDAEKEFNVGTYKLEATYGHKEDEGYEMPHFYGSTQFSIRENITTTVSLTAKYGNALVGVDYTDAFKKYFPAYTVVFNTSQGNKIEHKSDETRTLHVAPGQVSVNVNVTKPNGAQATYQATTFTAEAANHYHLTLDVNGGNVGSSSIVLKFDDMPDLEDVVIDLSQDLTNTPAPVIEPVGFENDGNIFSAAGSRPSDPAEMTLTAPGGFASVVLETFCPALTKAGWPESIDLMAATADEKALMQKYGFVEKGLWMNPQNMAMIDLSKVISYIPYSEVTNNESTFKLTMTDHLGQTSESVGLTVTIEKRYLAISNPSKVLVEDTSMSLDLVSNGSGIDDVTVQSRNAVGTWDDLKIVSKELLSRSAENTYRVTVSGLASDDRDISLRALVQKNDEILAEADEMLTVVRSPLPYSLIGDDRNAFSTYAILTVAALDEPAAQAAARAKLLLSTNGGTTYREYPAKVSGETLRVEGLTSGQKYVARITVDGQKSSSATFTTETPFRLPNRDMENWSRTPGQSNYWWIDYPFASGATGAHWDTYNTVTTSQGGSGTSMFDHKGCAYVATSGTQPTTDAHSGQAAIIRTVGWGSSNGAGATGSNWSSNCKYVSAGQLFLGDWTGVSPVYDSTPNYGVPCQARPKSLTFWYKYSQAKDGNGDYGTAYIEVFDAAGNPITQAQEVQLTPVAEYTKKTIELSYPLLAPKAAKIQVTFMSSGNKDALVPNSTYMTAPAFGNLSDGEYLGSSLYIDDLLLNY